MLLIECGLIIVAVIISFACPTAGSRWLERLELGLSCIARKRILAVFTVGLSALAIRAALLPILPIPEPIIHDEFGYLLAADTFSHGRLTNPTHPMWVHFESFSILQKPTYQCFAQPAQGMMLAFGKVVFGHPFWGVWLTMGVMCGVITWMLQGWLTAEWALLGGILAVLRFGIFGYWANSYWGGALGGIGGALVLGALPRIKSSQRLRYVLLMGLGLAILANSRPYEGFVFGVAVAILLFAWIFGRKRLPLRITVPRIIVPLTLVLACTAAGLGYYFWRVTGTPFRMPYQIERQTYAVAPYMLWEQVRPKPIYNNTVIEKMYLQEEPTSYSISRSWIGFVLKIYITWSFFFGPALTLPFLMLLFVLPKNFSVSTIPRSTLSLLTVLAIFVVGLALETFYNPHYASPITGLLLALTLYSIRRLRCWNSAGVFLSRAIPIICLLSISVRALAMPLHIPLSRYYEYAWYQEGVSSFGRKAIEATLRTIPGKHLVIVHYQPNHEPFAEWVYNDADIDNAKIVWSRELDESHDEALVSYFKNRQVWRLDADAVPLHLIPYDCFVSAGN